MNLYRSVAGRLGALFLLIALIPVVVTAIFSATLYNRTIEEERTESLRSLTDATHDRIEEFVHNRITDVNALSTLAMWTNLLRSDGDNIIRISREARNNLVSYISEKEYHDLLLIDRYGKIRFTILEETDLGENIHGEALRHTQLARVVDAATTIMQTEISNFAYYPPSGDYAAFIASPVFSGGRILGTIVLQIDQRTLHRVINQYQGIGETGDILAGTMTDGRLVITTPSRFDADLLLQTVDESLFEPLVAGLRGSQGGGTLINHRGREVLAEWRYLPSLNWGLVVMIDTDEVYAATAYYFAILTWIMLFAVLLAIGGTVLTYWGVSGPLVQFVNDVRRIKKDQLPEKVPVRGRYEIAELGRSFNTLLGSVKSYQSDLEAEVQNRTHDLKEALRQAEQANRAKGVFLATMSHEIRTPLNGVIGFTELLKDTPLTEKQRLYVESAQVSGKSLLRIINDILDLSKIEAGALRLEKDFADLRTLFRESVQMVAVQAKSKGLQVYLDLPAGLPWKAEVDEVRLKQVCVNLLSNAVKFTEKGEVRLKVQYESAGKERSLYTIEVSDTGIGIRPDQAEKLFSAFSQADTSTSRKYGGTGLGLVISRLLIEKMGGTIDFDSKPGAGTRFTMELETRCKADLHTEHPLHLNIVEELLIGGHVVMHPSRPEETLTQPGSGADLQQSILVPPLTDPVPARSTSEVDEPTLFDSIRVLVAEDTPLNMTLIKAVLKARLEGVQIIEARNGLEAVEAAAKNEPDFILMDVNMPEMDGLEATRTIRAQEKSSDRRRVPIVALTAGVLVEDRNLALESGMDGFLSKPLNVMELKDVMNRLLGEARIRFKN